MRCLLRCHGKDAVPISPESCPEGEAACGSQCYNPSTHYCCHYAGFARRNPPPGGEKGCPCRGAVFNPDLKMCSDGSVVGKQCMSVLTAADVDDIPLMGLGTTHNTCWAGITHFLNAWLY